MKILSNKRDDILKRRDEYEADYKAKQERYEVQKDAFYRAEHDVTSLVEEEVGAQLRTYSALQFDIHVSRGRWSSGGMMIRIQCNENTKFEDNVALCWSYNVEVNKAGEVTKESSSWSGLKATTPEQMESLVQTVEALKYLNSVDWATVLNKELPEYDDYFKEPSPTRINRPNFERELFEADLEEAVGQPVLVKGEAGPSSGFREGVEIYYIIHRETPAQYVVSEAWGSKVDQIIAEEGKDAAIEYVRSSYQYRIKKDNFQKLVSDPIQLIK